MILNQNTEITKNKTGLEAIKLFSYSTLLGMKFQLLIKTKMLKKTTYCRALKLSDVAFILLINVKMPTIVDILTFISSIIFMLS